MPVLRDLSNELLIQILDNVKPHDIENFTLSCKLVHQLATERLQEHRVLKHNFARIESNREPFRANQFPELLHQVLIEPPKADYVQQICIKSCPPHQYSGVKMKAFKEAVKNSDAIPFEEKERWISQIEAGNEGPILALLLPRLHYLTSIKISLSLFGSIMDDCIFSAVERVVKDPRSSSLSRLQQVEISGAHLPKHNLGLLTLFAGLPSVTSLKACNLHVDDSSWDRNSLIERSSNFRDLTLKGCIFSCSALSDLIKSAKSLRCFTYSCPENLRVHNPSSSTWARAALLQYASSLLEELSLSESYRYPNDNRTECSFKSYQNLRVLTIDYAYLMGDMIHTTDKLVTLLPASLEILNLFGYDIRGPEWFKDLVGCVARDKETKVPCLKELSFKETTGLDICRAKDMWEMCAAATAAGFELYVTERVRADKLAPGEWYYSEREFN